MAEIFKSTSTLKSDFSRKKGEKIKKGNCRFFNLKQLSLNSDENWPSYEFILRGNIIMILKKNNNNQGVFLELLVAAKK